MFGRHDTARDRDLEKLNLVNLGYGRLVLGFLVLLKLPQKMMLASKVVKSD